MKYLKSQMVATDYVWQASDAHDNPNYRHKPDSTLLNRREGWEMLYFINYLARVWNWNNPSVSSYNNLERAIRSEVPTDIRTHTGIRQWLERVPRQF